MYTGKHKAVAEEVVDNTCKITGRVATMAFESLETVNFNGTIATFAKGTAATGLALAMKSDTKIKYGTKYLINPTLSKLSKIHSSESKIDFVLI